MIQAHKKKKPRLKNIFSYKYIYEMLITKLKSK